MKSELSKRAIMLAKHIIITKNTVRQTALVFGLSKSTIHNDVSNKLKKIDYRLYKEVNKILSINFQQKHIRGGFSTKNKYLKIKNKINN